MVRRQGRTRREDMQRREWRGGRAKPLARGSSGNTKKWYRHTHTHVHTYTRVVIEICVRKDGVARVSPPVGERRRERQQRVDEEKSERVSSGRIEEPKSTYTNAET